MSLPGSGIVPELHDSEPGPSEAPVRGHGLQGQGALLDPKAEPGAAARLGTGLAAPDAAIPRLTQSRDVGTYPWRSLE